MENNIQNQDIRKPAVAGQFYPSDSERLSADIQNFLDRTPAKKISGKTIALICPHAGYIYSGQTASFAYKLIENSSLKKIFIIAPSHHLYFDGASVPPYKVYQTPLGHVHIDHQTAQNLIKNSAVISCVPEAHTKEHSLEVQLPFLQIALKSPFLLLPVLMGKQDYALCESLSRELFPFAREPDTLIIASSDLSHFHDYEEAKRLDSIVIDFITAFDEKGFSNALLQNICEACGGGPIITTMILAKLLGAKKAEILHYTNSGDITGDKGSVVGYLSAAIFK